MNTKPRGNSAAAPRMQRGVALVVVLLLLLVMTLLGLASLRGTLMEERMSAGSYDRSLSFQAAEAALREAEAGLAAGTLCPDASPCPRPNPAGPDVWEVAGFNCSAGGVWTAAATTLGPRAVAPVYTIELMGPAPPPNNPGCGLDGDMSCMVDYFRITACSGDPGAGRSVTILQSNYTP
jgi:type IV pilus assembly protein PilX